MRESIHLEMTHDNIPVARVPGDVAWDLVEYLSNQRVQVSYSFEASRVVVLFTRSDARTAANLLAMWARAEHRDTSIRGEAGTRPRHETELAAAHA